MAVDRIWANVNTSIFRVDGNNALYLNNVRIHKIHWLNFDNARVQISAPLPIGGDLAFLSDGDLIEVLHKWHGLRDEYIKEQVIARLSDLQIKRRWILDLSINTPSEQDLVILYTSFVAQIELFL